MAVFWIIVVFLQCKGNDAVCDKELKMLRFIDLFAGIGAYAAASSRRRGALVFTIAALPLLWRAAFLPATVLCMAKNLSEDCVYGARILGCVIAADGIVVIKKLLAISLSNSIMQHWS